MSTPSHDYVLLVTGGLEHVAAASVSPLPDGATVEVLRRAALLPGHAGGAAAGVGALLLRAAEPLPASVLSSPCTCAALAVVARHELPDDAQVEAVAEAVEPARWASAVQTRLAHGALEAEAVRFRVASLRGGRHSFGSRDVDAALGDLVSRLQPSWRVDLEKPDVCVVCVLLQRSLLVGLLLPPFVPRKSDVLPAEPRPWLCAGLQRAHMRPSRAAALVRLAAAAPGDVVLDPCGGVGLLAIEAACMWPVRAVSLDVCAEACAAARTNADEAARLGALRGEVDVVCADALRMGGSGAVGAASVDVAIADLPYGSQHERLDVGALLRELSRVVKPGGRCVLVANAGPGGVAAACAKAAARFPAPGAWRCVGEVPHWAGGVACNALTLELVAGVPRRNDDGTAAAAAAAEREEDVGHLKKVARRL